MGSFLRWLYAFFISSYVINCNAPCDTPNIPGTKPCNKIVKLTFLSDHKSSQFYAIESSESFSSVYFHESVDHSTIIFAVLGTCIVVVLQTETSLHHPNWICHDQREDSSFTCAQHVKSWTERLARIAALCPAFDRVVAGMTMKSVLLIRIFILTKELNLQHKVESPCASRSPRIRRDALVKSSYALLSKNCHKGICQAAILRRCRASVVC